MPAERSERPIDPTRLILFKTLIVAGTFLTVLLLVVFFRGKLFWLPVGHNLQRHAWDASFTQRGLTPPSGGIREGWNDQRIKDHRVAHGDATVDGYRRHPHMGWIESEVRVPGLLATDGLGRQTVEVPAAKHHLLILGGSVAFGANSSSLDTTYFSLLANKLAAGSHPVRITVGASGGWVSEQEVIALEARDLVLQPDVVLFLNGLNDIVRGFSPSEIVPRYLENMKRAQRLGQLHGFRVVFALQPCAALKQPQSLLERHIVELYPRPSPAQVRGYYRDMRAGLAELAQSKNSYFIDCSTVFENERATTFCDFWHFSDPGHEILAAHLAVQLEPILAELNHAGP